MRGLRARLFFYRSGNAARVVCTDGFCMPEIRTGWIDPAVRRHQQPGVIQSQKRNDGMAMPSDSLLFIVFLIFAGAAVFATLALVARQALIVSYIVLGVVMGPSLLGWVTDASLIKGVADIGIMFLLFLLGLNMHPQKLFRLLGSTTLLTAASSLVFGGIGVAAGFALGYTPIESVIVGGGLMFSSTIVGLKLLPTTVLHHRHTGEVMISILLLQDVMAIVLMLFLQAGIGQQVLLANIGGLALALVGIR